MNNKIDERGQEDDETMDKLWLVIRSLKTPEGKIVNKQHPHINVQHIELQDQEVRYPQVGQSQVQGQRLQVR